MPSIKTLNSRASAKFFGGQALSGTVKQVAWAETIRAEKIAKMEMSQAVAACDPNGLLTKAAWWIDHRAAEPAEIGAFVVQQKALLSAWRQAQAENRTTECTRISREYNALTERWGF